MRHLKPLALIAALVAGSAPAFAGGFAPVIVEPDPVVIVEEDQPRSTLGFLLPLGLAAGLVALAIASEEDSPEDDGDGDGQDSE
jgi:hypothetical protein